MVFVIGDVVLILLLAFGLRRGQCSEFSSVQREVAHDWTGLITLGK
jgi:hypothetical protein